MLGQPLSITPTHSLPPQPPAGPAVEQVLGVHAVRLPAAGQPRLRGGAGGGRGGEAGAGGGGAGAGTHGRVSGRRVIARACKCLGRAGENVSAKGTPKQCRRRFGPSREGEMADRLTSPLLPHLPASGALAAAATRRRAAAPAVRLRSLRWPRSAATPASWPRTRSRGWPRRWGCMRGRWGLGGRGAERSGSFGKRHVAESIPSDQM